MLYSSSSLSTSRAADRLLANAPTKQLPRKIQTSDPKEIDEGYLKLDLANVLGASSGEGEKAGGGGSAQGGEKPAFAVYEAPANAGNDALADMMGEPLGD